MRCQCLCGEIQRQVSHPYSGFVQNSSGDVFVELSEGTLKQLVFCYFCGGRSTSASENQTCKCGTVAEWTSVNGSHLRFEETLNEFIFRRKDQEKVFHFCPACGGSLQKSRRGELFLAVSDTELTMLRERLVGLADLRSVQSILGQPTQRVYPTEPPVREALFYDEHARTIRIVAQELITGELQIIFLPKVFK